MKALTKRKAEKEEGGVKWLVWIRQWCYCRFVERVNEEHKKEQLLE
jgi:hypothetical protein